ncbi:MAG: hypothetical protein J5997_10055 [Oscillospiraceae bacterium]|nr:hypothetical protein [Oscillospiraceae bacterium]
MKLMSGKAIILDKISGVKFIKNHVLHSMGKVSELAGLEKLSLMYGKRLIIADIADRSDTS